MLTFQSLFILNKFWGFLPLNFFYYPLTIIIAELYLFFNKIVLQIYQVLLLAEWGPLVLVYGILVLESS